MKRKILKRFMCLTLALLLIIVPVSNTYAASYTMNITKYAQERTKWCWAACAKMIGAYYGRIFSQSSICTHVKGSVVNQTATIGEVTSAIRYTSNRGTQAGVASLAAFIIEAMNSRPAALRMGWSSSNYKEGHVYVVRGARESTGSVAGGLYLIDPIAGVANAFYRYSSLVNGTTLPSGTGRYTHTWWTF